QYWQAGGDTSVAWDSKGNAYLSCQLFNRGPATSTNPDRSSGFFVYRSTRNGGGSWNFPGRPVFQVTQTSFLPLEDKQFMAVDNNSNKCAGSPTTVNPGSTCTPFQDRIYVTWTEFAPDGTAFIYEAYSADYGEHFSPRHLVSLTSPLCPNDYGLGSADTCNEKQFAQPVVGSDRALYVIWSNINRHSKESNGCAPAGTSPATGQDLYTGVKTPGACNNDILVSVSNDGGQTFTGTTTDPRALPSTNTAAAQATTDQFWQWIAYTKNGKLATSYYDRQYGTDEATGFSDVSLSGSGNAPDYSVWNVLRVTSSSMPFPTQFPEGGNTAGSVFWGDYAGLDGATDANP